MTSKCDMYRNGSCLLVGAILGFVRCRSLDPGMIFKEDWLC